MMIDIAATASAKKAIRAAQAAVFDIGSSCKERRDMPMTRRFS